MPRRYGARSMRVTAPARVASGHASTWLSWRIEDPRGELSLDLSEVSAVYLRPVATVQALGSKRRGGPFEHRAEAVDRTLVEWADLTRALAVNPPTAMGPNNSKPHQLAHIRAAGFEVPDTLVTTDPDAVRAFRNKHERIVYKSVSGVRSIVNVLGPREIERVADVANAPHPPDFGAVTATS